MSENKTKEEMLLDAYVSVCMETDQEMFPTKKDALVHIKEVLEDADTNPVNVSIYQAMQAYADQEKKSTAIAFKKWSAEHEAMINYADQRSYSDEEYYEMFLNSL